MAGAHGGLAEKGSEGVSLKSADVGVERLVQGTGPSAALGRVAPSEQALEGSLREAVERGSTVLTTPKPSGGMGAEIELTGNSLSDTLREKLQGGKHDHC